MTFRYIIVGLGNIGTKRKKALKNKLIATVDINNRAADYTNINDVSLSDFDAAILAIPNAEKIPMMHYLLEHGKHVIVEKPLLFNNPKEAHALFRLAKKNHCIWYTSYNHRFEPNIQKLKELIDQKIIGDIYFVKMIYGNGTVNNIKQTWRDVGKGVIEDLGCHLLDLDLFLFNDKDDKDLQVISKMNFESDATDFCFFTRNNGRNQFLCSFLMWKNTFCIELFGEKGSLHLRGLNKWGKSSVILRKRVYPSGVPEEEIYNYEGEDRTWIDDINYFEQEIKEKSTSFDKDVFISNLIRKV